MKCWAFAPPPVVGPLNSPSLRATQLQKSQGLVESCGQQYVHASLCFIELFKFARRMVRLWRFIRSSIVQTSRESRRGLRSNIAEGKSGFFRTGATSKSGQRFSPGCGTHDLIVLGIFLYLHGHGLRTRVYGSGWTGDGFPTPLHPDAERSESRK